MEIVEGNSALAHDPNSDALTADKSIPDISRFLNLSKVVTFQLV